MYIKIIDDKAARYTLRQLRQDNPNISFPKEPTVSTLAGLGVFPMTMMDKPMVNEGQVAELDAQPTDQGNGVYVWGWSVRPKTSTEVSTHLENERAGQKCSRLQGRLVLGEATCIALDAIAANPQTPWAMRETILNSIEWNRTSQAMTELGYLLGYTDLEMDALFIKAAKVVV